MLDFVNIVTHYALIVYLFLNAFQAQVPVVHTATWDDKGKPSVLMGAAKACGALFIKTKAATNFVSAKLSTAREDLVHEFVSTSGHPHGFPFELMTGISYVFTGKESHRIDRPSTSDHCSRTLANNWTISPASR